MTSTPSPPIPSTMQAVRVAEYNKPYILTTIPVPSDLGPHDLLVKVATASYCHTDSMVSSGVFSTALPCTASHEGAGTVVSVGASATSLFRPGDRVVCGLPLHACGSCADCLGPEQRRHYCRRTAGHVGVLVDGCLAEYVRVDARWTTPLPGGVSMVAGAPLACAGRTVWRAVVATGLGEGEWLAIVGSGGGLGHLGVRFAKARGLRVVGIDARDEALALSRECGADGVVDARMGAEAVAERVRELVGEGEDGGAHAAIVLADTDDAAALACAVTRMHGTVIQVAQPDVVKIPFRELIFRDIRVHGSVLCSAQDSRDMVEFVAEHGIEPKTVVFHGLESIFDLLKVVHGGKIQGKAVIIVDQDQIDQERKLGEKH